MTAPLDTKAIGKLGDELELVAGLIETNVAGARRRYLTVGEFLAGRIDRTLDFRAAEVLLARAEAIVAADETALHFSRSGALRPLVELTAELRTQLVTAEPFAVQREGTAP